MLWHFVQRLAGELTAFLLRFRVGVVRSPVDVRGYFPAEGGFYATHIGFIDVNAIADEVIMGIADGAGRIGTAVTTAHFSDFVLEVGIEQGDACVEVIAVIPQ